MTRDMSHFDARHDVSSDDGEDDQRRFTVLYATQTGNAQDVAERIGRQARRRHVAAHVCAMDEYDIGELINEALVVIVLGTTGNGDFPTSALPFWRFLLRSDLPDDILTDVTIATFGLGDSSYKRFCWPARKMNKRLRGLGAVELIPSGEADDQHYLGIEGTLRPWLDTFWSTLEQVLPSTDAIPLADDTLLPPLIDVRVQDANKLPATAPIGTDDFATEEGWQWARVQRNDRITAQDHWQDVRMIEFTPSDERAMSYKPTDVVSVLPENAPEDVERILDRLKWNDVADAPLTLTPCAPDVRIPQRLTMEPRLTLRRLLTAYVDFKSVPRPSFFERILPFTPVEHMQHEKLQEYCTPGEGADEMYEYAIRVRRTILEVLEEFDAVDIPVAYVLDVFPSIRKREFSIASAQNGDGDKANETLEIAVAIVDYKTRLKERRKGVCTSWLAQLRSNARVPIHIAPSAMATNALRVHTTPVVFVGPGTGVAPVRSAIWTRHAALGDEKMRAADNLCFFGCRNRSKDYLFGEEWTLLERQGCIEAHLAASRDQSDKVYVQDLVRREAQRVWDIVGLRNGLVYICGSAGKMPQAVRASVVEACAVHGKLSEDEAERIVEKMEADGRWIEECWE